MRLTFPPGSWSSTWPHPWSHIWQVSTDHAGTISKPRERGSSRKESALPRSRVSLFSTTTGGFTVVIRCATSAIFQKSDRRGSAAANPP